jgi:type I restriction enzyme M protein
MANNHSEIERRLWASADELRANSKLKSSEYSVPVLGLIFLRYSDFKFSIAEKELAGKGSGRRGISKEDYQAKGVMYLPPQARFSKLLDLPEGENIGKAINEAMKAVALFDCRLFGIAIFAGTYKPDSHCGFSPGLGARNGHAIHVSPETPINFGRDTD